jgi:predicted acylesterase/phospholipase RssA
MKIVQRFDEIRRITEEAAGTSAGALNAVASLASNLPTAILTRVARLQSQTVDFATSNVKGTPLPVFVAGSEILHNFPIGPLGGVAFNLTLLSHVGSLDMGLNIDPASIDDPDLLRDCLQSAFAELVAATPAKKSRGSGRRAADR